VPALAALAVLLGGRRWLAVLTGLAALTARCGAASWRSLWFWLAGGGHHPKPFSLLKFFVLLYLVCLMRLPTPLHPAFSSFSPLNSSAHQVPPGPRIEAALKKKQSVLFDSIGSSSVGGQALGGGAG
jgi:hypothetical protein